MPTMSRKELAALGVVVTDATKLRVAAPVRVPAKAPGEMNGTEQRYADILVERQRSGDVRWFAFESVTLKLADGVRYTPDFAVILADGTLEFHEVKGGFIRDDARVKLRVAARHLPFLFILAQYKNKAWTIEAVTP